MVNKRVVASLEISYYYSITAVRTPKTVSFISKAIAHSEEY
ncbi:hypothetical protein APHWI1_0894 [Anaplasma phagocytophilum str. ApWI1]|uniref:Uncharacterized protein n=1 Tax=Anaplasma phagocytophilum str. ApWI1 TaxID=1359155 RepID=A0A0F3PX61_ANAPH|nr:hypothetical protein APHWI1_0894 [Anaplasma phagocytophilum str. ApWI1]KJV99765.1 hypothetical protein OTSANNIE_0071 [Anaplasma phagocytophilum str. Annie]